MGAAPFVRFGPPQTGAGPGAAWGRNAQSSAFHPIRLLISVCGCRRPWCRLHEFPEDLTELCQLRAADLSGNSFESIPPEVERWAAQVLGLKAAAAAAQWLGPAADQAGG